VTASASPRLGSVLLAGGTGGLGVAVLTSLLDAGFLVTTTWLVEAEREAVAQRLGDRAGLSLVRADLMDPASVQTVTDEVTDLRAVVNLVGGYAAGSNVHESDIEDFEHMLRLNLRPGFLLARSAMPRFMTAGGGAFVAVSARAALQPFAGAAGYITAKAAVLAFVRALDVEYRDSGVRCNAILPGVIDTPGNRSTQPDADHTRWTSPEAIARAIRFLVSDDAEAVTGAAVPVYGRS
jgi:NAD(P)-dependent dehydrogenase (short-subunit alcohol dehydrogenase family)